MTEPLSFNIENEDVFLVGGPWGGRMFVAGTDSPTISLCVLGGTDAVYERTGETHPEGMPIFAFAEDFP